MTELHHSEATGSEAGPPNLSVTFGAWGSHCVLTLRGELTRISVAALDAQVDQIGCAECNHLILDVTELTEIDEVGRRVLAGLDIYLRALGAQLTIFGVTDILQDRLTNRHQQ